MVVGADGATVVDVVGEVVFGASEVDGTTVVVATSADGGSLGPHAATSNKAIAVKTAERTRTRTPVLSHA